MTEMRFDWEVICRTALHLDAQPDGDGIVAAVQTLMMLPAEDLIAASVIADAYPRIRHKGRRIVNLARDLAHVRKPEERHPVLLRLLDACGPARSGVGSCVRGVDARCGGGS